MICHCSSGPIISVLSGNFSNSVWLIPTKPDLTAFSFWLVQLYFQVEDRNIDGLFFYYNKHTSLGTREQSYEDISIIIKKIILKEKLIVSSPKQVIIR